MAKTIIGVFDEYGQAESTVQEVINLGIVPANLGIIMPDAQAEQVHSATAERDSQVLTSLGAGAAVGGLGGLVAGFMAVAIAGIGPVLVAGPLLGALAGAGIGATAGGYLAALLELGVPKEEAEIYAEAARQGETLVFVVVEEVLADRVVEVMERYSAVDIEERARQWRQSGWKGNFHIEELRRGESSTEHRRVRMYSRAVEAPVQETQRPK